MLRAVACASAAALASAGAAPQGGNYQQFLDQWAQGYGHYASTGGEGGKDDKKGAGGGSFDYSQYMAGGQGAQAKTSSATALGSFDYSKYMGGANGGSSMTNSSGYSDYMKKYGDYSKYTGGNGSSGGGDYSNYSKYTGGSSGGGNYSKYYDYSKYTSGAGGPSPAPKATGMAAAGGGDFMKKYGDWQSFVPKNESSGAGGAGFNFSSYVPFNYSKYRQEGQVEQGQQNQTAAMSATDCHDMSCLKAWRAAQMSHVDKFSHYAPKVGQDAWSNLIKDQYETNKKRILVELQENVTILHPVQEPWWLLHGVTPDGPPKAEGGAEFSRFSAAQQEHFGINAKGEVQDQAKFDKAIAALDAEKKHNTTAASAKGDNVHSQEQRSKAVTVTRDERNHSREAAAAKAVEVNAAAAARDPPAVGTVPAAPGAGLSASPVEESRGVDPARWFVLGCAMLVAAGVAVRAARARPLGSLPEEDPNQAYLALA